MKRAFQAHRSDTHEKIKTGNYVYMRANQNVEKEEIKKTSTAVVQTDDPSQQKSDIRPSNSVRSLFCDAIEQESLVTLSRVNETSKTPTDQYGLLP